MENINKTPTHNQSTTNFTWKYIIDRKTTNDISTMFKSIELLPLAWDTPVHSLKVKSIYFSAKIVDFNSHQKVK